MNTVAHHGKAYAVPPKDVALAAERWRVTVAFTSKAGTHCQLTDDATHETTANKLAGRLMAQARAVGGVIRAWHVVKIGDQSW